ncbi:MAG: CPBP family glutamic-type intramembrane protease [Phycisphaerae bacterium]
MDDSRFAPEGDAAPAAPSGPNDEARASRTEASPTPAPPDTSPGLPPPRDAAGRRDRPWGFWATLGWSVLWLGVFLGSGVAIFLFALLVVGGAGGVSQLEQTAEELAANGLLLGLVAIVQTPLMLGLTALLAWIRMPAGEYLGLRWPSYGEMLVGLVALLALIAGQDLLSWSLERPIVAEFMLTAYRTAGFLPVLVVALLVAAPLVEEVFFRGFMYKGLAASKAGVVGAILITSIVWAAIHLQYDWYGKTTILVIGLFLGVVRWRTKSITLPILLHGMMNAVATVQTAVVAEGWA